MNATHLAMVAAAILVINGIVKGLKEDVKVIPWNVPPRWRPLLALVLGQLGAGAAFLIARRYPQLDVDLTKAIEMGLAGSAGSSLLHGLVKDTVRDGRPPSVVVEEVKDDEKKN